MRKIKIILFGFLSLFFCGQLAATNWATGDSLNYLTPKDTIYLKVDENGQKFSYHILENGQTLYSMARFYGLTVEDVIVYNPGLDPEKGAPLGTSVKIPIPNIAIQRYYKIGILQTHVPVMYKVKKGDTMYGISKRMFKMGIDTIMYRNNLLTPNLELGQVLHVGWMSMAGIPNNHRTKVLSAEERRNQALKRQMLAEKGGRILREETGVAVQMKNGGKGAILALHSTAKIGSKVEIRNPMTNKKAYAKVIGRVPRQTYGSEVKVVVSPQAAKILGALDNRFYVEIKFYN